MFLSQHQITDQNRVLANLESEICTHLNTKNCCLLNGYGGETIDNQNYLKSKNRVFMCRCTHMTDSIIAYYIYPQFFIFDDIPTGYKNIIFSGFYFGCFYNIHIKL